MSGHGLVVEGGVDEVEGCLHVHLAWVAGGVVADRGGDGTDGVREWLMCSFSLNGGCRIVVDKGGVVDEVSGQLVHLFGLGSHELWEVVG